MYSKHNSTLAFFQLALFQFSVSLNQDYVMVSSIDFQEGAVMEVGMFVGTALIFVNFQCAEESCYPVLLQTFPFRLSLEGLQ